MIRISPRKCCSFKDTSFIQIWEEYYLLTIEVYDWNYQIFEKLFDILQTLLRFLHNNAKHEIVSTELRVD